MSDKEKQRILVLLGGTSVLLIALMVYLTYFMIFEGERYRTSSLNKRNTLQAEYVTRGSFYDNQGELLASTIISEDGQNNRRYTYPELYSHIIGYSYKDLGKAGLELSMDDYLTNQNNTGIVEALKKFFDKESIGNSVHLTINTNVQKKSADLLDGKRGAVISLNPKTGEIYSMVSKPDFNPNTLRENWEEINNSENYSLFNRAVNGLYPPGSVMKVISSAAILESTIDQTYLHTGSQIIDGYEYKDATKYEYGNIGIQEAFTKSLNTYYVEKIQDVGMTSFASVASRFMFEKEITMELPVSISTLNYNSDTTKNQVSASAIGQGRVLATPLEMALTASAIANQGKIMKPYLVNEILNKDQGIVKKTQPQVLGEAISPEIAKEIKDLMVDTTNSGTGTQAQIRNVQVASKTGTSENETGNTHAWYIGFAPAEDPQVAVAVIVEQGGSGGTVAAPIGRDLIISTLNNINN